MFGSANLDQSGVFGANAADLREATAGPLQDPVIADVGREQDLGSAPMQMSPNTDASMESGEIRSISPTNSRYRSALSDDAQFAAVDNGRVTAHNELCHSRWEERDGYREIRTLGQGGNGKCFLLRQQSSRKLVACKVTRGIHDPNELTREFKVLRDFLPRSSRILEVYDVTQSPERCQIYVEYLDGGDLHKLITHYQILDMKIPEYFIWHAFRQLSEAIAFIHFGYDHTLGPDQRMPRKWRQVIHADLKPENVFLRLSKKAGGYPDLVLGDFGAAVLESRKEWVGTYEWAPPEMPIVSPKGDVWCMGATIHALAMGGRSPIKDLPLDAMLSSETRMNWSRKGARSREVRPLVDPGAGRWYSLELEDVVREAMNFNAIERSTSYDVLQSVCYEMSMGIASPDIFEYLVPGWEKRN